MKSLPWNENFSMSKMNGFIWTYCLSVFIAMALVASSLNAHALDSKGSDDSKSSKLDFTKEVRPILASHCFKCHGMDDSARKAKLRLDVREDAMKPAKSGELAVVPGKPDKSELVHRIFTDKEDDVMPPPATKSPLTASEKDILKRWIAQGAKYSVHWAFTTPKQAALPKVHDKSWAINPIDNFILARLEKEGVHPSPHADKYTLVRRVYLDLTGLPPTPEQADAFVNDPSPNSYEKVVDQLLASKHYGERWARRWLDLARYADTNGYEKDRPRNIWAWRDWVINALNSDMPFSEFTIEQLAGDLLPNPTQDQIVATGFHRNTMINEEGGIDSQEYRYLSLVDRVHVTSTAWLGLTMSCAQCHTHKYDPIPTTEYYRFMAFLNNADEPTLKIKNPELDKKREEIQSQVDDLEKALPDKIQMEKNIEWMTPGTAEFTAQSGIEAEFLTDGSFRLDGNKADKDIYTIQFESEAGRITHVGLEAIPDEKISAGGPGNSGGGNYVLSELEMEVVNPSSPAKEPRKIKFSAAEANFSQDGFPVEHAIDGKLETGWAVGGGKNQRHAVFTLAEPLDLTTHSKVTLRLTQNYGRQHTLGRFRLSLGHELQENQSLADYRQQFFNRRFAKWLVKQTPQVVQWTALHPSTATSTSPSLTIQPDDSIFVSGDFTKSDRYTVKFKNVPSDIKAIRLEMLPDDRLPNKGPGSTDHEGPEGDFWLSTITAKADGKDITLTNASESFANGGNNAEKAIDNDAQSGWSISGGQGKPHYAVFQFKQSATVTNEFEIGMLCEKYYAAGLGRFRIWVTSEEHAIASKLGNDALEILAKNRDPEKLKAIANDSQSTSKERSVLVQEFAQNANEFSAARREIASVRSRMPEYPTTLVMQERSEDHKRHTYKHHRGEYLSTENEVTPNVPSFLPPLPEKQATNRLALAKWIVSGQNPLTGRVLMNRQWEALFGRGLVRTTEDFGFQGESPSHPELLDWLAVELVKQGWSQKKMLKLLVMSATYQQSSAVSAELRERDPLNILLTRGPRLRLDVEMIRDSVLEASGLLSRKIGGPSVFPPQPPGVSTEGTYGALDWKVSEGEDRYRRALYTFAKRTAPYAMTTTFDGPSGEACLARRDRSNTPLQALSLLNDSVFMECAQALGKMAVSKNGDDGSRVDLIFRRCLVRPCSAEERQKLLGFYQAQLARFAAGELKSSEIINRKEGEHMNEEAAWTTLARVLLNLDETITKS